MLLVGYWLTEFMNNPFKNQARVTDSCDAILDSDVYNGHTTAVDALWVVCLMWTVDSW